MDASTIAGCRAKVDRAEAAIDEGAREWTSWLDTNPYPTTVEVDRTAGEHSLYFDFSATEVPLSFSARVGEIAHGLRSALDHLIWREAVELCGYKTADENRGKLYFPLLDSRTAFKYSKVKGFVSKDAWAVIERYQPYTRGKPKRSRVLALLHEIDRIDKHRSLHVGVALLPRFIQPWSLIEWDEQAIATAPPLIGIPGPKGKRLKRKTEIARYFFDPAGPDPKVRMKKTPPLNVSFGDIPRKLGGAGISETVREVREVIGDFAALMP